MAQYARSDTEQINTDDKYSAHHDGELRQIHVVLLPIERAQGSSVSL